MPRARNPENAGVFTPGSLSYLPKRAYSELFSPSGSEIPDGCYGHPVLILSTDQRKKEAVVLILTSFRGKTLDEYSPLPRIRGSHLPIHPSPPHPDNGILLYLDQNLRLPKKTYVKTETPRSIRWHMLQAEYGEYRTGKRYRLTPESFAKLLQYISPETLSKLSKTQETPRHPPSDDTSLRHLLASMRANSVSRYGSISPPPAAVPPPPPQVSQSPRQVLRAQTAPGSTLQSVARSREGVAAATERDIAQWHDSRRQQQQARSILPTYRVSTRSNPVAVRPCDPVAILRRLFVILLVIGGVFLIVAWWRCQRWMCR